MGGRYHILGTLLPFASQLKRDSIAELLHEPGSLPGFRGMMKKHWIMSRHGTCFRTKHSSEQMPFYLRRICKSIAEECPINCRRQLFYPLRLGKGAPGEAASGGVRDLAGLATARSKNQTCIISLLGRQVVQT